ncbi:MYB2 [Artemisia annua]|uniref:MYB2 n=1 Tax=Artemisia annua TaxID=35608 RepID=A0A2U1MNK3_ARTAN|nr:MYB2 [Artemisia annua]
MLVPQKKDIDEIEGPWSPKENKMLLNLFEKHGRNWSLISKSIPGRSAKTCMVRWFILTLKRKSRRSMNNEDITIRDHEELLDREHKTKNYLVAFEGARGQAPSIGDIAMDNVSQPSRGTHSYSRDQLAPSWNALNKQDSSRMMIDSDNKQAFVGSEIGSQNNIYEGNSSHAVGGVVNGQAPSISDMARGNMSSGG